MEISCLCLLSHQEPHQNLIPIPKSTNANCQSISRSGQNTSDFGRMFFCITPPSHEKGSLLERKIVNLANHIFKTPMERPEVGIKEQKKVKFLALGEFLTGFKPFKRNEIKQMPKCWSCPGWRWGLNDTNDHPQCNCQHALALGNS